MRAASHPAWLWPIVAGLLAAASAARAQIDAPEPAANTLLIVRTPGDERIVSRITGELGASSWNVVEIGKGPEVEQPALAQLARSHAAIAALRFDAANATLELWIARAEGAADGNLETLSVADADERVPAFRVTEALRARGLIGANTVPAALPAAPAFEREPKPAQAQAQVKAQAQPESPSAPASPAVTEAKPPLDFPLVWLEVAPALAISAGGLGPAVSAWIDVRLQPAPIASVSVFALAPLWSERLRELEGSARISVLLVGAGADLQWRRAPWELALRAGAGAAILFMRGDARGGFASADQTVATAAVLAGPSLHFDLSTRLRACARAIGAVALPRAAVRFADREVAHWGRPFVLATLGLEYAF